MLFLFLFMIVLQTRRRTRQSMAPVIDEADSSKASFNHLNGSVQVGIL